MSSLTQTQKNCIKLAKFPDAETLFDRLDSEVAKTIEKDGLTSIPYRQEIFVDYFWQWVWLLGKQFPCLIWRGSRAERGQCIKEDVYLNFLFDRFFLQVDELPALKDMGKKEKDDLREWCFTRFTGDELRKRSEAASRAFFKKHPLI